MTTPVQQMTIADLEASNRESTLARAFYVFRRWPLIPIIILSVLAICAVFSSQIAPYEPEEDQLRAVLASPAWYPPCEEGQLTNKFETCNTNGIPLGRDSEVYYFIIGADQLGRDLLSRIIFGARLSLSLAAIAIAIGTLFGTTVGLVAGYYGRHTRREHYARGGRVQCYPVYSAGDCACVRAGAEFRCGRVRACAWFNGRELLVWCAVRRSRCGTSTSLRLRRLRGLQHSALW